MDRAKKGGGDAFQAATAAQVKVAIEDAGAVIQVVDVRAGVQPMDEEVSRLLRAAGKPVVLAANKADEEGLDDDAAEFARLGWETHAISAAHGRGVEGLVAAVLKLLPKAAEGDAGEGEGATPTKVAEGGRPNAGKSSYINRLTGKERLIVSEVAGTTRDSIEVPFELAGREYVLVDTAGMRKKRSAKDSVETFSVFRAQRAIEEADLVVLVVDAVEGPGEQEKKISGLIRDARKGCVVLVNKWDHARNVVHAEDYEAELRKELFFLGETPVVFVSAKNGYHVKRSFEVIGAVAGRLETRLPTGVLNRVLRDAFERSQPPFSRGKQLKFYYATQTGTRPPRITLFVNAPGLATPEYQRYLEGRARGAFELAGVPLEMRYRSSHDPQKGK